MAKAKSFADRAIDYARAVDSGDVVACRQVRLAARRMLDDLDAKVWRYDADRVAHVCQFAELLPHVKGKWAGQLIRLEPFQIFILANLFGFVGADGRRRFRQALVMLPRKSGKSALAAVIALYMAFADAEPGAEVFCGAATQSQAYEVFRPAKQMATKTPALLQAFGITVAAQSIFNADGSFFKPVIGRPGDGSSPHCWLVDEYHEHDDSGQVDTAVTGMGAREQPLLLVITTAGTNAAGPCRDLQLHAETVLEGQLEDDRLFAVIYTVDPEDDWRDFATWRKANPALGVSISEAFLRERLKEAIDRPAKQAANLTKHLNIWVSSASAWINRADWADCATAPPIESLYGQGLDAWIGLDLATKSDIAALTLLVRLPDGRDAYYPFMFLPSGGVDRSKNSAAYAAWIETGDLIATDGNATDFATIEEVARDLATKFRVRSVGFDPYQAHHLAQNLASSGLTTVEYPMRTATLSPPMVDFEASILDRTLCHSGNPAFDWMAANVTARPDPRGNLYPRKPAGQDHLKIDAITAALMAKGLAMADDAAGQVELAPLFVPC